MQRTDLTGSSEATNAPPVHPFARHDSDGRRRSAAAHLAALTAGAGPAAAHVRGVCSDRGTGQWGWTEKEMEDLLERTTVDAVADLDAVMVRGGLVCPTAQRPTTNPVSGSTEWVGGTGYEDSRHRRTALRGAGKRLLESPARPARQGETPVHGVGRAEPVLAAWPAPQPALGRGTRRASAHARTRGPSPPGEEFGEKVRPRAGPAQEPGA